MVSNLCNFIQDIGSSLDDAISQNSPKFKPKTLKTLTEAAWEEVKKSVRDDPILSLGMDRAAFGSTMYVLQNNDSIWNKSKDPA